MQFHHFQNLLILSYDWNIVLIQQELTEEDVINNFEAYINDFCEQYHLKNNIPRNEICKIMIDMFRGRVKFRFLSNSEKTHWGSDDWMRKRIDQKYKQQHRVRNANKPKLGKIERMKNKISELESQLYEATGEVIEQAKKDF